MPGPVTTSRDSSETLPLVRPRRDIPAPKQSFISTFSRSKLLVLVTTCIAALLLLTLGYFVMPSIPPILTGHVPTSYPGTHPVGYFVLSSTPRYPYVLPSPRFGPKDTSGVYDGKGKGPEVLGVREIKYSVFYPCEEPKRGWFGAGSGGLAWLPRPFHETLKGYQRFLNDHPAIKVAYPILRVLGGRLKIPLHPLARPLTLADDADLASTSTSSQSHATKQRKRPLVIFSHGLAGTLNAYSHFCASLASRGYTVLAIAHQDGSGPVAVLPRRGSSSSLARHGEEIETRDDVRQGPLMNGDGPAKVASNTSVQETSSSAYVAHHSESGSTPEELLKVYYVKADELDWDADQDGSSTHLRSLQIEVRLSEIYETYDSFKKFVGGGGGSDGVVVRAEEGLAAIPIAEVKSLATGLEGIADVNDTILTGHSFGGGSLLHVLQSSPPRGFDGMRIPVQLAIALDPWVEPLPAAKPPKQGEDRPEVPLFIVNSEGFTLWKSHFQSVLKLAQNAKGALVSVVGCDRESTLLSFDLSSAHRLSLSQINHSPTSPPWPHPIQL